MCWKSTYDCDFLLFIFFCMRFFIFDFWRQRIVYFLMHAILYSLFFIFDSWTQKILYFLLMGSRFFMDAADSLFFILYFSLMGSRFFIDGAADGLEQYGTEILDFTVQEKK
ncbi:hypothetical protein BSKO_04902 [Bryopsis sp. KO-2023]|nr:hypothetical protein BSKO_04902 [Bryopsis sp. KO-2023]